MKRLIEWEIAGETGVVGRKCAPVPVFLPLNLYYLICRVAVEGGHEIVMDKPGTSPKAVLKTVFVYIYIKRNSRSLKRIAYMELHNFSQRHLY
jgi:hypothetical protein